MHSAGFSWGQVCQPHSLSLHTNICWNQSGNVFYSFQPLKRLRSFVYPAWSWHICMCSVLGIALWNFASLRSGRYNLFPSESLVSPAWAWCPWLSPPIWEGLCWSTWLEQTDSSPVVAVLGVALLVDESLVFSGISVADVSEDVCLSCINVGISALNISACIGSMPHGFPFSRV